jgi:hypothetical protein
LKRLGVIGTMVWDTIHGRDVRHGPVEEWGGIAYALAGLEAALSPDWEIVPLIKVGRDLAPSANRFLRSLSRRSAASRFVEVPTANNRVTLRYETNTRRLERLSGGVPVWSWEELGPMVVDVDAMYINFISGFELSLDTAVCLRHAFDGPIYADVHSLLLGLAPDGLRFPQTLPKAPTWFSCFDIVQTNEDEMTLLGPDPMVVAAAAFDNGVRLLVCTLGPRGAAYFTQGAFRLEAGRRPPPQQGPITTALLASFDATDEGDTTGCGDVFGATLVAQLLAGTEIEPAIRFANRAAGRNVVHRGATNLHYFLRGAIAPQ